MKKLVFVVVFLIASNVFAQHAIVQQIAQQVNQDSLVTYVKQLTGLLPIGSDIIKTRYRGTTGNTQTEEFIFLFLEEDTNAGTGSSVHCTGFQQWQTHRIEHQQQQFHRI
jgi:hypothetical protein